MTTIVSFEEAVEIPAVGSLEEFRRWALSEEFPQRGRIDYIAGRIEVDMSPEDVFSHGVLKVELIRALRERAKEGARGVVLSDRSRITSTDAGLSVEPDIVFVSNQSLQSGRVRLVSKASGGERYVELEGAPELIVEVVSDSSVRKDTVRLPVAYYRAGVDEFWLADARGPELVFQVHRRGPSGFEAVAADADGFQHSAVLGCRYRLSRFRSPTGHWDYDLQEADD